MKLLRSSQTWGCILTSAAMVLDCTERELIQLIGHDGSEIIFPELCKPACHKGFHVQEIVLAALKLEIALIRFESRPVQTPDHKNFYELTNMYNFEDFIQQRIGILVGSTTRYGHAVAWDGVKIYDPRGRIYRLSDCKINIEAFYIAKKI